MGQSDMGEIEFEEVRELEFADVRECHLNVAL